jgi:hypothetical protein
MAANMGWLVKGCDARRGGSWKMKWPPKQPAIALLGVAIGLSFTACGGAGRHAGSAPSVASTTGGPGKAPLTEGSLRTVPSGLYLSDRDNDEIGDADGDNNADNDHDASLDYKPDDNGSYHDADDRSFLTAGRAASFSQARTIATVVRRYYALVAAGDGAAACAQLTVRLADAVPVDYGEVGSSSHLRGGKTCAAIVLRVFKHFLPEFAGPVEVTDVRVYGDQVLAFIGSKTLPACYTNVEREGGIWKVAQLLPGKLF